MKRLDTLAGLTMGVRHDHRRLFTNRDGGPLKAIKKGFLAACERAGVDDLRPYDLRHTFATRLIERGVHRYVISALLGHSVPATGFGHASRITPGYGHVTWDAMVAAVESLEATPEAPTEGFRFEDWQKSGKSG